MFDTWIFHFLLLLASTGAQAFMIYNTHSSLCLEDSATTDKPVLKKCDLDSESQQWMWISQGMLASVASSRCLSVSEGEIQTQTCYGTKVDVAGLLWDCDRGRLVSRSTAMMLSITGQRLILTHESKHSHWRSLDEGDICQEKLRSKRASHDREEFEAADELATKPSGMTDEQREYLRWYYRTEDSTVWRFVLLGVSLVCLLVGFLLLGMGAMANKNRKIIAKYKTAAAAAAASAQKGDVEELLVMTPARDDSGRPPPPRSLLVLEKSSPSNGELNELKAGNIVVTWKNGNASSLYSDPAPKETDQEEASSVDIKDDEKVVTVEGFSQITGYSE